MNKLQNCIEENHDMAAKMNMAITDVFLTPDGMKVQIMAEMKVVGGKEYPRYKIVKVIE